MLSLPDYEVMAGTMDDFADVIWQYKDKLLFFGCLASIFLIIMKKALRKF